MATEIESIGLAMDTSGVERGIKSLDELAARGPKVEQSMQGVERAAKQAGQGVSTLGQGATAAGVDPTNHTLSTMLTCGEMAERSKALV